MAAFLAAVAWPITVLVIVLYFRGPIRLLVTRAADSLKVKSTKFKFFGIEVELTPEETKDALDEMLQEVVQAMSEFSKDEIDLFTTIHRNEGRLTVFGLDPNFKRGDEFHNKLRKLRRCNLVRPVEGGKWEPEKHPVVTRFGRLVLDLTPKLPKKRVPNNQVDSRVDFVTGLANCARPYRCRSHSPSPCLSLHCYEILISLN